MGEPFRLKGGKDFELTKSNRTPNLIQGEKRVSKIQLENTSMGEGREAK